MARIFLFLALLLPIQLIAADKPVERWVAKCSDGKNIHYVQKAGGVGHLFMDVETPMGTNKVLPIATVRQNKVTPVSICGTIQGNNDPQNNPISQVCMNRELQILYIKFDHPEKDGKVEEGKYCKAKVDVFVDF